MELFEAVLNGVGLGVHSMYGNPYLYCRNLNELTCGSVNFEVRNVSDKYFTLSYKTKQGAKLMTIITNGSAITNLKFN